MSSTIQIVNYKKRIPAQTDFLDGQLRYPEKAKGLVLFSYDADEAEQARSINFLIDYLNKFDYATLQLNLFNPGDRLAIKKVGEERFNVKLLANRLLHASYWCRGEENIDILPQFLVGESLGSAAALIAAASLNKEIQAVVSLFGRADLAFDDLNLIQAPTLLIAEKSNPEIVSCNERAIANLNCQKNLAILSDTKSCQEKMNLVSEMTKNWFDRSFD